MYIQFKVLTYSQKAAGGTIKIEEVIILFVPLVLIGITHKWIARSGSFLLVLVNLPMTIMHELAHFTVAFLLNGKPSAISVWPIKNGKQWKLGHVAFQSTTLSTVPTALAPLLWLLVAGYLLLERHILASGSLKVLCGIYLCSYMCVSASIPSRQDIRVILRHPLSLMMWAPIIFGALCFLCFA